MIILTFVKNFSSLPSQSLGNKIQNQNQNEKNKDFFALLITKYKSQNNSGKIF